MSPATNIKNLMDIFNHPVETEQKLIATPSHPTKVELNNVCNHGYANTINILDPNCVSGVFEFSIHITTPEEWVASEFDWVNQEIYEVVEETCRHGNIATLAVQPPKPVDNSPIIYTEAIWSDCLLYPKL